MAWEFILYLCGLGVSAYLLLLSREWVSAKRWYDVPFLQGTALLAWSLSNLAGLASSPFLQAMAPLLKLVFLLFILLTLHAFPRMPHLYYDHWKTRLDAAVLVFIYGSAILCMWVEPGMEETCHLLMHVQSTLFLLIQLITVWISNADRKVTQRSKGLQLLHAMLALLIVDLAMPLLSPMLTFWAGAGALFALVLSQERFAKPDEGIPVQNEYLTYYQKLNFQLLDANMVMVVMFAGTISFLVMMERSQIHSWGMALALGTGMVRYGLTQRQNRGLMAQTFHTASSLEQQFACQLEQIKSKNARLSQLLTRKESYENLLLASNDLSLQEVSYENLHQVIEELVDTWSASLEDLVTLRLSLEAADGTVYYEATRGEETSWGLPHLVSDWIVVDEKQDSPLCPRYVRVMVQTSGNKKQEREWKRSFVHLLAVNVRGLILRCLQNNHSLELRLMEQEMELAKKIQFSLIPRERYVQPHLQAKAVFLPVTYVGGDYVDFFSINERYTCFLVADVSGHGIPASLLTTGIRSALRAVIQTTVSPEQILYRLNRLLYEDLSVTRSFITMLIVVYDAHEHKLRASRAGHPQPFYFSQQRDAVLSCPGGMGLGLAVDSTYRVEEWSIVEDGLLMMYTDGLLELGRKREARDTQQWLHEFGALVRQKREAGEDCLDAIETHICASRQQLQQTDDISVLMLEVRASRKNQCDKTAGKEGNI